MSDLKYQSLEMLRNSEALCINTIEYNEAEAEKYQKDIDKLEALKKPYVDRINGQMERLRWIRRYIERKTVRKLTLSQIEEICGHKVEII